MTYVYMLVCKDLYCSNTLKYTTRRNNTLTSGRCRGMIYMGALTHNDSFRTELEPLSMNVKGCLYSCQTNSPVTKTNR